MKDILLNSSTTSIVKVNDWYYFEVIGIPLIVVISVLIIIFSVAFYMKAKNKKISFDKITSKFKLRQENEKQNSSSSNNKDENLLANLVSLNPKHENDNSQKDNSETTKVKQKKIKENKVKKLKK